MRSGLSLDKTFLRDILRIGLPVAIQNVLTSSLSLIDSLMIGSQGELALASVGIANQWGSLLFSFYWGICCGGTLFFAQYWGAEDVPGIRRAYAVTMTSMLLVALAFCAAGLFFPLQVMALYSQEAPVQELGAQYLRIVAIGYITTTFNMALSGLLRSTENVKLPLFASLMAIVTNTFLNWVLIYGKLGMPALGVEGAAIATVISGALNTLLLFAVSYRQGNIAAMPLRALFAIDRSFLGTFYRKSMPIITNEVLYGLAMMLINMVLGRQGAANFSAMTIFRTLEGLIFAFFNGLSNASSVIVGKKVGAGQLPLALRDAKRFALLCPASTFAVCLAVLALRMPILGLFSISDAVRSTAASMLAIYTFTAPMRTCNYIQVNMYRAGGESRMGMYFEVGGIWLVGVPLVYLAGMVFHWPFALVFAMLYVEDAVKLPMESLCLRGGRWIVPVTEAGRRAVAALGIGKLPKSRKKEAA